MTRRCALVLFAALAVLEGCASVNPQSALRLAGDGQLTARAVVDSLEQTRRSLETFVESQALHAHLTGRSTLSPSELCSIKAVQRSLRLRVLLLRKLGLLYDTFIALVHEGLFRNPGIYDDVMASIDRYELLPDATPGPTCPDPDPDPQLVLTQAPVPTEPGLMLGLSASSSTRRSSQLIRGVLGKFIALWERERDIYLSIQRQAVLSQKTLTRALLVKFGTVSPAAVFAPQLTGLGVDWDDASYRAQVSRWPADRQAGLQEAVLSVLDRRAERRIAEEEARYAQHTALLRILYQQHQALEQGQPLDLRQIALFLSPLLRSVNPVSCECKAP